MNLLPSKSIFERKSELRRKKLVSQFTLIAIIGLALNGLPDLYFGIYYSAAACFISAALFGGIYYINQKVSTEFASHALLFCSSLAVFFLSGYIGRGAWGQLYYFPILMATPFIIRFHKNAGFYIHLSHPVLFYILLEIFDFQLFPPPELSKSALQVIAVINYLTCIFIIQYFVFAIITSGEQNQKELVENEKILRAQNMELVKVNRELDRFVYSVGHDLRAPITSVLGLVNLSKEEDDAQQLKQYNLLKEKSLKKLDVYIKDILDFSRNSRLDLQKEEIDFNELMKELIENLQFAEDAQNMEFIREVNQAGPFVTDNNRLSAVLNNLISNSIRYSDKDKENSYIKVKIEADSKRAQIKIIDNGIGIEKEHLSRIFDMFYRANYNSKGTGLGLYIVKETIEKLKGTIEVDSNFKQGTTFTVTAPNLIG